MIDKNINTTKRNDMKLRNMIDEIVDRWYLVEDKPMNEQIRFLVSNMEKFYRFGREAVFSEQAEERKRLKDK